MALLWAEAKPLARELLAQDTLSLSLVDTTKALDREVSATGGRLSASSDLYLRIRVYKPLPHVDDSFEHLYGVLRFPSGAAAEWVLTSILPWNVHVRDTLQDVNGDGAKDFVQSWYPMSGCCIADVDNVFLFNPESGEFAPSFEVINPVYAPEDGIVYGMKYGHPGDAPFYTQRFVGLGLEPVECVYRTPEAETRYAVATGACISDVPRRGTDILPESYEVMIRYRGWFEGGG